MYVEKTEGLISCVFTAPLFSHMQKQVFSYRGSIMYRYPSNQPHCDKKQQNKNTNVPGEDAAQYNYLTTLFGRRCMLDSTLRFLEDIEHTI